MERVASSPLASWLEDPHRRPLVLRGARQVGKTWLVRDLAARTGRDLVELNFERDPQLKRHFASNDPTRILGELSLMKSPEKCLTVVKELIPLRYMWHRNEPVQVFLPKKR